MHPLLPASTAAEYALRGALGLERHGHEPGVALLARLNDQPREAWLHWLASEPGSGEQLDRHQITEDAAEAITLTLVHAAHGWVVRRRLQRGESGDWLLRSPDARLVALEVSGIDEGDEAERLRAKLEQIRAAKVGEVRAACVVELASPRATLAET